MTPEDRAAAQEWLMRRHLQLRCRIHGRRKNDKPLPPSLRRQTQIVWYIKRQLGLLT